MVPEQDQTRYGGRAETFGHGHCTTGSTTSERAGHVQDMLTNVGKDEVG